MIVLNHEQRQLISDCCKDSAAVDKVIALIDEIVISRTPVGDGTKSAALLQAIPDLFFRVDRSGIILDYHAPDEGELYLPPPEFLGKQVRDVMPPDLAQTTMNVVEQVLMSGEPQYFEYHLSIGQQLRYYQARVVPYGEDQIISIVRDITDLRQANENVHLFHQAVEASASGIIITDAREPDYPLIYVNPAFEQVTGYTKEETLGRNCRFLQKDDRDQDGLEEIRGALREKTSCTVTLRNYRKDGTLFWNELHLSPIFDDQGGVTHFVGVQNNVTERKQAEQQALELKLAHERARIMTDFLRHAAHEFRTPLTVIQTSLHLMSKISDSLEQEKRRNRIQDQADHILRLVNSLSTIVRLDNTPSLPLRGLELNTVMRQLAAVWGEFAKGKNLTLSLELDEALPIVAADEDEIVMAIGNLIDNALRYTPEGGSMMLKTAREGDYVVISVQDTGSGIEPELMPHIFEPLYRANLVKAKRGFGLGLPIVQRIAQLHGGQITASSTPGEGSLFRILLPISK